MLIMATKVGLEHWLVRNVVAAIGNLLAEKDPGTTRISNCGAFSNEFWTSVSLCFSRSALMWTDGQDSGHVVTFSPCQTGSQMAACDR
jgi:hypothetical protein